MKHISSCLLSQELSEAKLARKSVHDNIAVDKDSQMGIHSEEYSLIDEENDSSAEEYSSDYDSDSDYDVVLAEISDGTRLDYHLIMILMKVRLLKMIMLKTCLPGQGVVELLEHGISHPI